MHYGGAAATWRHVRGSGADKEQTGRHRLTRDKEKAIIRRRSLVSKKKAQIRKLGQKLKVAVHCKAGHHAATPTRGVTSEKEHNPLVQTKGREKKQKQSERRERESREKRKGEKDRLVEASLSHFWQLPSLCFSPCRSLH